jgi:hypothetical protein
MSIQQIDITNACHSRCSNCTRLIGHHGKDKIFFMSVECFKKAVDSFEGFNEIVGIIGGDPVLHPDFVEMCEYLYLKRPNPKHRGLWSSMPAKYYEHFAVIQRVFPKWQFLNDRGIESGRPWVKSTPSIHTPMMVAVKDVVKDEAKMWELIDNCWVQKEWSSTITPKGAFVCEVMGAWDNLLDGPGGLPVEPGWWKIQPSDPRFQEQVKRYCPGCGGCLPANRRESSDIVDDISASNLERLKDTSPKIKQGKFVKFDPTGYSTANYDWNPNAEWYLKNGAKDRLTPENQAAFLAKAKETGTESPLLDGTAGITAEAKQAAVLALVGEVDPV